MFGTIVRLRLPNRIDAAGIVQGVHEMGMLDVTWFDHESEGTGSSQVRFERFPRCNNATADYCWSPIDDDQETNQSH